MLFFRRYRQLAKIMWTQSGVNFGLLINKKARVAYSYRMNVTMSYVFAPASRDNSVSFGN